MSTNNIVFAYRERIDIPIIMRASKESDMTTTEDAKEETTPDDG